MSPRSSSYDEFELIPEDADPRYPPCPGSLDATTAAAADQRKQPAQRDAARAIFTLRRFTYIWSLLASVVPLALLLGFTGKLSRKISESACTPGGEFVVPLNTSIWDSSAFFEITIPFIGPKPSSCGGSVAFNPSETPDCVGYSFTKVKVIDLAWDVLVGRGGQACLTLIAYRLFSRVVVALMEQGEVSYELFVAVAFETGSWTGFLKLFLETARSTPVPRTRRALWCYVTMFLATSYIVAFPSLISAMTGYTTRFRPFVRRGSAQGSNGTLVDCYDMFLPVWGRLGTAHLHIEDGQSFGIYPLTNANVSVVSYEESDMWIDYYHQYQSVYDSCPKSLEISSCSAAQRATTLTRHLSGNVYKSRVNAPMPGIIPFRNETDPSGKTKYRYWQCGYDQLIDTHGLTQSPDFDVNYETDEQTVGVCQAAEKYVWGFSFLLTFLVAVLQVVFVMVMYMLWLVNCKGWKSNNRAVAAGTFPDAVTMVTQAQRQHGDKLDEWSEARLKREIVRGKTGMTFLGVKALRERKVAQGEVPDDDRAGDWSRDVGR